MRFNESFQTLRHCWEDISSVFYDRYPNPHSKHVLSEDVVMRKLENNILKTKRIFAKTNEVPGWLFKFLPTTTVYILEESHIDLKEKTIVTYSKNITHNTLLSVEEKCVFSINNEDFDTTLVQRQAWIESFFIGLAPVFESFGLKRYKSNILRMHRGFDSVLRKDQGNSLAVNSSSNYTTTGVPITNVY